MRGWGEQEHEQEGSGFAGRAPARASYLGAKRLRRWGSVRLPLTLWNVAVLALILGALGGVARYTAQARMIAKVDEILARRVPAALPPLTVASWQP